MKESPHVGEKDKKLAQQVLGSFLYYARAIDLTTQQALNTLAEEQFKSTEKTLEQI